jgi:hypothetical protein
VEAKRMQTPPEQRNQDEKGPKKAGDGKKDQFEYIAAEIRRQADLANKIDDSLDTKISIMLGFILLVLSQVALRSELVDLVTKGNLSSYIFIGGFVIVFFSIVAGLLGYFVSDYYFGPNIPLLIEYYRRNRNLNQIISKRISSGVDSYRKRLRRKAQYFQVMVYLFVIGFILIIVLELCCLARLT